MFCHERFLDHSLSEVSPIGTPRHSLETGCIFTEFFVVINVSI